MSSHALPPTLSPSVRDVLAGAARGESIEETARRRVVSPLTVKSQRRRAIRVLGARSLAHAVAIAHDRGIIP